MLCYGVDGNRNFKYNWLTADETGNEGGSRVPCTDTYGKKKFLLLKSVLDVKFEIILAGAFPYSEPETQATENFLQTYADKIDAFLAVREYIIFFFNLHKFNLILAFDSFILTGISSYIHGDTLEYLQ